MKRKILVLIAVFVTVGSAGQYSCADVLEQAYANSKVLHQLELDKAKVESMKKEYFGMGLPNIEGSVNYQFAPKQYSPFASSDGPTFSEMLTPSAEGWYVNDATLAAMMDGAFGALSEIRKNTIAMSVTLTQPLFAKGNIFTGLKIAKEYLGNIELQIADSRLKLAKEIMDGFSAALLADQNLMLRKEAVALAEESLRLSKVRFETGKGAMLDTLNAKYSLQEAILAEREALKNRTLAVKSLFTTAVIEEEVESVILVGELQEESFNLTRDDAEKLMTDNGKAMERLRSALEIQKLQTKVARNNYFPTVYAGVTLGKITQFNIEDEEVTWGDDQKFFVGATVPIFSGGQRLQKLRQAQIVEEKLLETKDETLDKLKLGLRMHYEEMDVAMHSVAEAKQLVVLAEQAFRISKVAYEEGQITLQEYRDSEQRKNFSTLAYNNAVYKLNSSIINIKYLISESTMIAGK